ncbi:hypothetical protein [Lentzea sp. NBRC 102530]|uniref:DUF6959 family protein n=1 Tax=Lentzea sp. NBRC 102530 TaxID=3032201 RepID=UPI0024A33EEE|nr:hypothetical protein [Lentzea sp. NBRC 102530]GLY50302.1 hypothetical protein Lesp01_39580 [Lentzea sp. NBRC 102530]
MDESTDAAEVLAVDGNFAVVQLPGRNFPAAAIQGDSLSVLRDTIKELSGCLAEGDLDEAEHPLAEIESVISAMMSTYEDASRERGFKLPYAT